MVSPAEEAASLTPDRAFVRAEEAGSRADPPAGHVPGPGGLRQRVDVRAQRGTGFLDPGADLVTVLAHHASFPFMAFGMRCTVSAVWGRPETERRSLRP